MALPRFTTRYKDKNPTQIIMHYRFTKANRLKYYTGQFVNPSNFSTTTFVSRKDPRASSINQHLRFLSGVALDIRNEMLQKGRIFTNAEFKNKIDLRLGLVSNSTTWYEHATIIYNEKLRLKRGDTESVKWFLSKIKKIHSHIGDVSLAQISKKYFRQIIANEYNSDNSPAYINKLLKITKQVCKDAEEENEVHQDYKYFKLLKATTKDTIYNTLEEVEAIYYKDYGNDDHLRNTANIYIIGCFTSLRASDFLKVAKAPEEYITKIKGVEMIKVDASQKTKTKTIIPLHPIVKDMLNKYEISHATTKTINENLKEIGKLIGMDQEFTRLEWPGGVEQKVTYQRWELLSSHCARRSFVSIMWSMGVPARTIMLFTGHKSEKQLMEYMKLTGETNAIEMAGHEFFQKRSPLRKLK